MENNKSLELIKAEIERRIENYWSDGDVDSVVVSGELEELIDFIDSLPEEKPSEDLEEAAEDCVWKSIDNNDPTLVPKFIPLLLSLFISGAEWQKEQMTKDAVEGYITFNYDAQKEGLPCVTVIANEKSMEFYESRGFKLGDKVKIIIVKNGKDK